MQGGNDGLLAWWSCGTRSPSLTFPEKVAEGNITDVQDRAQEVSPTRAISDVPPASSGGSEGMGKLLGAGGLLWSCVPLAKGDAVLVCA